jgi:TonB family protein
MRQVLLCFSLICTAAYAHAQETIYLGADSLPSSIADAKFKLLATPIDSFPIYLKLYRLSPELLLEEGPSNDKSLGGKTGCWTGYFDNGKPYYTGYYLNGKLAGKHSRFHYTNGELFGKGVFVDDKRDGIWHWYHPNKQLASTEEWYMDSLIAITAQFKLDGAIQEEPWALSIAPQTLNMNEVTNEMIYPKLAKRAGIEGKVKIRILVSEKGEFIRLKVIESIHPLLDEEASKAARKIKFTPLVHHNVQIVSWVNAPFRFKLTH